MTILQLSVFIENKKGALNEILSTLAENKINIIALILADTNEFGLVRMILSDPEKALVVLREKNIAVRLHDVLSLEIGTDPGALSEIMDLFLVADINMEYVYAFSFNSKAMTVFRTDNREKAVEVIKKNSLKTITLDDLKKI